MEGCGVVVGMVEAPAGGVVVTPEAAFPRAGCNLKDGWVAGLVAQEDLPPPAHPLAFGEAGAPGVAGVGSARDPGAKALSGGVGVQGPLHIWTVEVRSH